MSASHSATVPAPRRSAASPALASERFGGRASASDDALYPCSDGEPMSDNMWQGRAIHGAAGDIEAARPQALVAADILMYPEKGNPKNRVGPDVLVAFGVGTHSRSSYLVWREGKPPDLVLEVASPRSAMRDLNAKRVVYAGIGVPEYWLFDAKGDVFPPGEARLQGLGLDGGRYAPLVPRLEDGLRMVRSRVLDLDLRVDGELIRFRDPATGKDVRHHAEAEAAAVREAQRAEQEAARADAAQLRVAELEAAMRRRQGPSNDAL